MLRFGTDGLRGVANSELTPELALALGRAAARRMGQPGFLTGRDTRRSGGMLQAALSAGLASEGARVIDAGVIPTPGLAWLAADRSMPAAMISASHNAFPDNGIKLLSPAGTKLPDAVERAVEAELELLLAEPAGRAGIGGAPGAGVGETVRAAGAVREYAAHLAASVRIEPGFRLSVVCDCANGAASVVAPLVLAELASAGVSATVIHADPDGLNINSGCGSTHPESLADAVLEGGADLGLGVDGDADRVLAIDHRGELVDGDELLAMFALDLDSRGELAERAIAVTVMSNLGLRRALAAVGIELHETPVGDRHVADALETHGLVLGGEQSGHIVFRRHATTGDGILTGLKVIELIARRQVPLAELAAAAMTRLPQVLVTVEVSDPRRLDDAAAVWSEVAAVDEELAGAGRVLLRASGTEPAVRVMVEAETVGTAESCADRLAKAVRRELGER